MADRARRPDHQHGARIERLELRNGGAAGTTRPVSRIGPPVASFPDEVDFSEESVPVEAVALREAEAEIARLQSALTGLTAQIGELEFTIREHVEIELARDLEIGHLESELTEEKERSSELSIGLFHSRRRAEDLDRRWNELAATYEACAANLVEAGALLESIHRQSGYRVVVACVRAIRRFPVPYRALRRLGRTLTSPIRPEQPPSELPPHDA